MNLQNLDFTPLWITMKTGVAATFVSFFLGIFAAEAVLFGVCLWWSGREKQERSGMVF